MSSSDDESSYGGSYSSGSYESSDDEKETKEEEESEDSSEMMVIEIAFGKGKEDSIIVHWNDNPLDLAKHGMKEAAIQPIAAHISSTIEDFKAANAELRAQSPSLDETYSESGNGADYHDTHHAPSEPMDLPLQTTPELKKTLDSASLQSIHKADHEKANVEIPESTRVGLQPAFVNESDDEKKRNIEKYSHNKVGEHETECVVLEIDNAHECSSDNSQPESLEQIADKHGREESKPSEATPVHDRYRNDTYRPHEHNSDDSFVDQEADIAGKQEAEAAMYSHLKNMWKSRGMRGVSSGASKPSPLPKNVVQRSTLLLSKNARGSLSPPKRTKAKSAGDRLYQNAGVQAKRKELLKSRAAEKEEADLRAGMFQLSASSRAVVRSISSTNSTKNITERLYDQGVKKKAQKEGMAKKREEERQVETTSWSCLQCGTLHNISSSDRMSANDKLQYKLSCPSCGYSCEAPLLPFQPTNINSIRSGYDDKEVIKNRKKQDPIHEYLYANRELQVKKSHLVSNAWDDEDEVFTFRPVIPESSKALLAKHNRREVIEEFLDKEDMRTKKITVASEGLDKYLSLPVTARLIIGETLCRQSEPGKVPRRKTIRKSEDEQQKPLRRSKSEVDETFNRLVNEFWEIRARREKAEKLASKYDMTTKKRLFKPSRGPPCEVEKYKAVIVDTPKEDLPDRLIREGIEHDKRIHILQKKYAEQESREMEEQKVHALPKSQQILDDAMQQNIEEIFKILVANQEMILHAAESDVPLVRNKASVADMITELTTDLGEDWNKHTIDVRLIDPEILVEEMRDILREVKRRGLNHVKKRPDDSTDNKYKLSFKTFAAMIKSSLKKRDGVGRAYIYTPKPRDDVTRHLLVMEAEQSTFQPSIQKRSAHLARRKGRTGDEPIEDILRKDGHRVQEKINKARQHFETEKYKDCSFQPKIFKTPKHVLATYRGQERVDHIEGTQEQPVRTKSRSTMVESSAEVTEVACQRNLELVEGPVVGRLSKSNIAKVLSTAAPNHDKLSLNAFDDDASSTLQSVPSLLHTHQTNHEDNEEARQRSRRNLSPKPARHKTMIATHISSRSDVSSNIDSRSGKFDHRRSDRPRHSTAPSNTASEYGEESHSVASSISSVALLPPRGENSKVDTMRNRKSDGRKNSWHGALATGWMEKDM